MYISQNGIELIKNFEGCILSAYDDGTGTPTIGYGHIEGVRFGQTITQAQADEMLKNDLQIYSGYVQKLIDNKTIIFPVSQNMFDALVSFCYNLGYGNLTTLVTNRDSQTVAKKMLLYVNANGQVLQGLVRRRNAERELFLKPVQNIGFDKEYDETGRAVVIVNKLNIRDNPSLNGNIVGGYFNGESFIYNHVIINDGYVWVSYKAYSGKIRYVAVKEMSTGKRLANCY